MTVESLLASAAAAIAGHEPGRAIELLLDAYASVRSHALSEPIEACARRATHWQMPRVEYGTEISAWRMQADAAHPSDLGRILAANPERAADELERFARSRRAPDPRIARALLPIASGQRAAYLGRWDWSSLFRSIVHHGDDAALAELARLGPTLTGDAAGGFADLKPHAMPRALTAAERAALDRVTAALAAAANAPALEALGVVDASIRAELRAVATGDTRALAALADSLAIAAPALVRLLAVPDHPARLAILQLLRGPWRGYDFFERFPDLNSALAQIVDDGWSVYLRLLDDPDPAIRVAALALVAHLHVPLRDHELAHLYLQRAQTGDPAVRAAFLVAAGRIDRAGERPREWPLDDPEPIVRFAAAVCEALGRKARITREALAILEAPPSVDTTLFPWFHGDLGAMSRAVIRWLELLPIESTLGELEQQIRANTSRHDDHQGEWRAAILVPRVFGRPFERRYGQAAELPPGATLDATQQRLVALLAFYRSKALDGLRVPPPEIGDVRRTIGIDGRTISVPPSRPFDEWTLDDVGLLDTRAARDTDLPGVRAIVEYIRSQPRTLFLQVWGDLSTSTGAVERSGIVAMAGAEHLTRWIASGHRCDSLRILSLSGKLDPAIASASLLRQLRWLRLQTSDPTALLESPQLAELELLDWRFQGDVRVLPRLSKLQSLAIDRVATAIEPLAAALAAMRAPLSRLAVSHGAVPIDAIAGNDAFAIEVLGVEHAELRGPETFGALRELRVLRAARSTFDDVAAAALATCERLESADLSHTALTDAGAWALARGALGALSTLDLRGTAVCDHDAIAALAALPRMRSLHVPFRVAIELWLSNRAIRGVALPDEAARRSWRPVAASSFAWITGAVTDRDEAVARAVAASCWPSPPAGFTRRFVHEVDEHCPLCGGSGYAPGEGHCPNHLDSEQIRYAGDVPYDPYQTTSFASAAPAIERAEQLAAELARAVGGASPTTLAWRFDRDLHDRIDPEPSAFDRAHIEGGQLGKTILWPIERRLAHPDEPLYRIAVAILDAGFSIGHVTDDTIELGFHVAR